MIVGMRMPRRKMRGRLGEMACKIHFVDFLFILRGVWLWVGVGGQSCLVLPCICGVWMR